jgi:hypothetical protein
VRRRVASARLKEACAIFEIKRSRLPLALRFETPQRLPNAEAAPFYFSWA